MYYTQRPLVVYVMGDQAWMDTFKIGHTGREPRLRVDGTIRALAGAHAKPLKAESVSMRWILVAERLAQAFLFDKQMHGPPSAECEYFRCTFDEAAAAVDAALDVVRDLAKRYGEIAVEPRRTPVPVLPAPAEPPPVSPALLRVADHVVVVPNPEDRTKTLQTTIAALARGCDRPFWDRARLQIYVSHPLERVGVRVQSGRLLVGAGWPLPLRRELAQLPGAEHLKTPQRFGTRKIRAVAVPLSLFPEADLPPELARLESRQPPAPQDR